MSTMTPVPADAPLMVAWKAYQTTEEYANAKRWATHEEHAEGSLWAAFAAGFATPSAPPAPAPGGLEAAEIETMARLVASWQYAARSGSHREEQAAYRALESSVMPRVAQLVAVARRGMEDAKHLRWIEENAGAELRIDRDGDDVEVRRWHRKYLSYHNWFGRGIREALSAARASRPTEEPNG